MNIEARLAKLETESRRWRMLALGLLVVGVVAVACAAAPPVDTPGTLSANKLRLFDANNDLKIELAVDGDALVVNSINTQARRTPMLVVDPKVSPMVDDNKFLNAAEAGKTLFVIDPNTSKVMNASYVANALVSDMARSINRKSDLLKRSK